MLTCGDLFEMDHANIVLEQGCFVRFQRMQCPINLLELHKNRRNRLDNQENRKHLDVGHQSRLERKYHSLNNRSFCMNLVVQAVGNREIAIELLENENRPK